MQRYFIYNICSFNINDVISINNDNPDYHHIKNVMRMKNKDRVFISTNNNDSFLCEIINITTLCIDFKILEKEIRNPELPVEVTVAMGLVRREKTEEVLRRVTELGASSFIQVIMARSIVKIKDYNTGNDKLDRMKKIVKEASEQSHRVKIPEVLNALKLKEFIKHFSNYDIKLFAYEESGRNNDKSLKSLIKNSLGKKMVVLTGPEGGFDIAEVKLLEDNGFISVGLGPRILRCETAPLYLMSAISYELELGE